MRRVTVIFSPQLAVDTPTSDEHVTVDMVPGFSITIPTDIPPAQVGAEVRKEIIRLASGLLQSDRFELSVIALVQAARGAA